MNRRGAHTVCCCRKSWAEDIHTVEEKNIKKNQRDTIGRAPACGGNFVKRTVLVTWDDYKLIHVKWTYSTLKFL